MPIDRCVYRSVIVALALVVLPTLPLAGQAAPVCIPLTAKPLALYQVHTALTVDAARQAVVRAFHEANLAPVADTSTTVVRWWVAPRGGAALPPGGLAATLTPVAGGTRIIVHGLRVGRDKIETARPELGGWQAVVGCSAQQIARRLAAAPALTPGAVAVAKSIAPRVRIMDGPLRLDAPPPPPELVLPPVGVIDVPAVLPPSIPQKPLRKSLAP